MLALDITREEVETGVMRPEHVKAAVQAIRTEGVVVLHDVIEVAHLDLLREKMLADLELLLARKDAPFNFNTGNVQQEAPPYPPYLFRDVLVNDMVIAVTRAVLGPGVKNSYYSGNTAVPSRSRQPVHADVGQLWADLPQATPAYGLVVNVPVVDMSPENGSTEIWPGTHLDTSVAMQNGDIKVSEEALAKYRSVSPPLQPTVRRGSVVIRDIRMWHAGMPNLTAIPRPMIAMIHWIGWWNDHDVLTFPKGTEAYFEHPHLKTNVRFVESEIDYISRPGAYDFKHEEADAA